MYFIKWMYSALIQTAFSSVVRSVCCYANLAYTNTAAKFNSSRAFYLKMFL